jgi:hypothetical protein
MHDKDKMTMPAMPAAFKKIQRPTLVMKMPIEAKEEKAREQRERGRYSIIVPRSQEA